MKKESVTIPWPAQARPRITVAGCFVLNDQGFTYTYRGPTHAIHLHEYKGLLRIEEHEFELAPGILTLTPAEQISAYHLARAGQHWCVHFHPEWPDREPNLMIPLRLDLGPDHAEAAQRLARIAYLHLHSRTGATRSGTFAAAASVALQDFLLWLALREETGGVDLLRREPVRLVMEILNRRLHLPLPTSELAAMTGWSPDYLARRFREQTGQTIAQYLLHQRIERARLLLLTTDLPVKQVGARVGLPDPHYFNKQMRRVLGRSPSALRRAEA